MNDADSLAEKIIRDIESVYNRDQRLVEFEIIPQVENCNKSPVVHIQHNLGLESWCVKHVFNYAQFKILEVKKLVSMKKLLYDEYDNVNRFLMVCLLINPDVITFWNLRRELICDKVLEDLKGELKYCKLVLSHKPKSNEVFGYRRFILNRMIGQQKIDKESVWYMLSNEFSVCNLCAIKASNNYHAWNHRIWCVENILDHRYCDEIRENILHSELISSDKWTGEHVSEHTGFHYRQYIINKCNNIPIKLTPIYTNHLRTHFSLPPFNRFFNEWLGSTKKRWSEFELQLFYQTTIILLCELVSNNMLLVVFVDHESIWSHRRFIIYELFAVINKYLGVTMSRPKNLELLCAELKNDREKNIVLNDFNSCNVKKYPKMIKCEQDLIKSAKLYDLIIDFEKELLAKTVHRHRWESFLSRQYEKWMILMLGVTDL